MSRAGNRLVLHNTYPRVRSRGYPAARTVWAATRAAVFAAGSRHIGSAEPLPHYRPTARPNPYYHCICSAKPWNRPARGRSGRSQPPRLLKQRSFPASSHSDVGRPRFERTVTYHPAQGCARLGNKTVPIRYLGKTGFFATKEYPRHPIGIAGIIWLRGLDLN